MTIDPADRYFSLYVRTRDSWQCQRCKRIYPQNDPRLQCSHYFGRRMESVRFDPENCDSLCFPCHRYWEKEDREAYRGFKVRQLGQKGFDALNLRAHLTGKKDRKMQAIIWKKAYEESSK